MGEIVPLDTFDDLQTMSFVRPDLREQPIVCQLHCGTSSNIFRLLSHSCRPSAQFAQVKASGQYVMTVRAIREIPDGAQITVFYGSGWKTRACLCETCRGRDV
ncbi:hypothetical protein BDP55DRAFT_56322 [Colletotrichum godetiae]|uniref:SET domain-containing protein n=1 Tax=Colletotrichum godetiae TaxID=1209918 RepID=A0AAJ0A694_9PEZI|nr:uncharacterized protein BDP55DRAFT_56322 [Colletotrichum godetiae]KAK1656864.1 hypothetical protein BDP55DRAFT_56322 [Colletotrichum godetiae]